MRATREAVWMIGLILIVFGTLGLIVGFSGDGDKYALIIFSFGPLLAGIIMTIIGLVKYFSAKRYNEAFVSQYQDKIFVATCFRCGHEVECLAEDFSEHRLYPDGYVYCSICRQPLSFQIFDAYDLEETYGDEEY